MEKEQKGQALSNLGLRWGEHLEEPWNPNEFWVSMLLSDSAIAIRLSFVPSIRTVIASEMNSLSIDFFKSSLEIYNLLDTASI